MSSPTLQHLDRFQVEADMLAPLARATGAFSVTDSIAMFEVPCSAGVPDIVFVDIDESVVRDRGDKPALTELIDIRIMMIMSREDRFNSRRWWSSAELSEALSVTKSHLRQTVLPRMVTGGHLERRDGEKEKWRASYRFRSLARYVATVEAKLRDWRRGLAQASRHASVADAAWLALDAKFTKSAIENPMWFSTYGVGLAAVSSTGHVDSLISPSGAIIRGAERELLVERALALHWSGHVSGEVRQVFGRHLLASKGDDPRLAGASGRSSPLAAGQ
ncbi:hypothetical protein [Dietzia kunjamensis]|uniref:hypothetical protein n=1 Tax=Dietzia kunjamensis TaxID=322509 RepID=UPI003367281D